MFHIVLLHNAIPLSIIVPNTLKLNDSVVDYHCAECHSVVGCATKHYAAEKSNADCHVVVCFS